mmetsp:Transcript_15644/g.21626  ORF Transcript_15644/g.21626 Transcript_15644/m.21626 type:complete len:280 (-) Transcript_15644:202-1041(-)|eukprot:CAMPEP_0196592074 /NCGR_PEP_ID=MMETSP1081-20130531/71721_1 /TAXON_ID=36882 /ORGANISM="Pyramimonas amylifera, Strain CCMP720" /LENGTH=279 /DNA_ID=CAMNT_0041915645 /DNA_START=81 /DNA_END=920 /DNA_ORIENTATION=-
MTHVVLSNSCLRSDVKPQNTCFKKDTAFKITTSKTPAGKKVDIVCESEKNITKPNQLTEVISRRHAITLSTSSVIASTFLRAPEEAFAIQGLTAGRVPGIQPSELEGFNFYERPDGKSGGHGVGWSEIPKYSFNVPEGWGEVPVSIADLGGSEVDLRFSSQAEGDLAVVVAPVLRFYDVGYNASVIIEELGTPEQIIKAFAPEIIGQTVEEDDIVSMTTKKDDQGLTYYLYDLKPHFLIAATAFKNRLFIMTVRASSLQWRKAKNLLPEIQSSFKVSTA